MWCGARRNSPCSYALFVAGELARQVSAVQCLSTTILMPRTRVTLFSQLRHIQCICRYVIDDWFRSVMVSPVHSRLDCGNFVLVRPEA